MKKFDYENQQYLEKLNDLNLRYYSKYIEFFKKSLKSKKSLFLDVGCGNGEVLLELEKKGFVNGYGLDVSKLFVKAAKSKGLENIYSYSGKKFPFKNSYFDLVGSFNVLEHTQDPEGFLKEQLSKLKEDGVLIVACPNFLSFFFPNPHRRLKGFNNKFRNFRVVIKKLISKKIDFEKMAPVVRKKFEYDDDAIVVTNLIDLKNFFRANNCEIVYESGFINYDSQLFRIVNNIPFIRYGLPSCFVVVKKNEK